MKITLVGYMASGKSLVGKRLADELGLPFIDLDERIESKTGELISDLLPIKSGLYFRKLEREVLLETLEQPNYVLASGGGTPCYYNNMVEINKASTSFYLQETPKTLADRLKDDRKNRPLIKNISDEDLFEFVAKHLFERRDFYEAARFTVRGENKVEQILNTLK